MNQIETCNAAGSLVQRLERSEIEKDPELGIGPGQVAVAIDNQCSHSYVVHGTAEQLREWARQFVVQVDLAAGELELYQIRTSADADGLEPDDDEDLPD